MAKISTIRERKVCPMCGLVYENRDTNCVAHGLISVGLAKYPCGWLATSKWYNPASWFSGYWIPLSSIEAQAKQQQEDRQKAKEVEELNKMLSISTGNEDSEK